MNADPTKGFESVLEAYRQSVLLGDKPGQDSAAETLRSMANRHTFTASVAVMRESSGESYYVALKRNDATTEKLAATPEDGHITPSKFKVRAHADYEVREWNLFFGNPVVPNPLDAVHSAAEQSLASAGPS